jgi:hypothetical protein
MGGLFTGMFLGFCLLLQTRYTRQGIQKQFRIRHLILQSFGFAIAIVGPIIMLIVLYTRINPKAHWCEWCEAVNCAKIDALWFCDASGCSDDQAVRGWQFPNGTVSLSCPSFVGKNVSDTLTTKAEPLDVIKICRARCFPPL